MSRLAPTRIEERHVDTIINPADLFLLACFADLQFSDQKSLYICHELVRRVGRFSKLCGEAVLADSSAMSWSDSRVDELSAKQQGSGGPPVQQRHRYQRECDCKCDKPKVRSLGHGKSSFCHPHLLVSRFGASGSALDHIADASPSSAHGAGEWRAPFRRCRAHSAATPCACPTAG